MTNGRIQVKDGASGSRIQGGGAILEISRAGGSENGAGDLALAPFVPLSPSARIPERLFGGRMANWITLSRFPLLVGYMIMLYYGSPPVRLIGVPVLFILLMLDTVDGAVARARGQTSLLGSVLDIAADRAYELVLWVALADLGVIPVAIPITVILRTTLTDALRSLGVAKGLKPFEQHRSTLGRFLVASPWMRTSYSITKITAFCGLALGIAFSGYPAGSALNELSQPLLRAFAIVAWAATAICVLRGAPVILGGLRHGLKTAKQPGAVE